MRQKNLHVYCTWYKSLSVGYNPPHSLHVIRIQEFPIEWASKHFFQVYFGPIFGLTTMQCGFIEVYNHNHPTICHIVSFSPNCSFTLSDGMAHSGPKLRKKIWQKFVKLIDHNNAFSIRKTLEYEVKNEMTETEIMWICRNVFEEFREITLGELISGGF